MRYCYDWEFLEDGHTIHPISIGVLDDNGREYYAINSDADWPRIRQHRWLRQNVLPHLPFETPPRWDSLNSAGIDDWMFKEWRPDLTNNDYRPLWVIRNELGAYFENGLADNDGMIKDGTVAELWSYYAAYDHVALMQLWGPMVRKPAFLPMLTKDIKQLADELGVSTSTLTHEKLGMDPFVAHNALHDARHHQAMLRYLRRVESEMQAEEKMRQWDEGQRSVIQRRPLTGTTGESADKALEILRYYREAGQSSIDIESIIDVLEGNALLRVGPQRNSGLMQSLAAAVSQYGTYQHTARDGEWFELVLEGSHYVEAGREGVSVAARGAPDGGLILGYRSSNLLSPADVMQVPNDQSADGGVGDGQQQGRSEGFRVSEQTLGLSVDTEEGSQQGEGSADSERGPDEGTAQSDGEEGGPDQEAPKLGRCPDGCFHTTH